MALKLLRPDGVKDWLLRRYAKQHRSWFDGGGEWPLAVPLGSPTERDVIDDIVMVRAWVDSWAGWRGVGALQTVDRKWPRMGSQTLPVALSFAGPSEIAVWCGQESSWGRARKRADVLLMRWPQVVNGGLGRFFDLLADYHDNDFERLLAVLSWALSNPASGLYMRQLPIVGVDTKWLERRTTVVAELLTRIRAENSVGSDMHETLGLRKVPHRIRMRILCPQLRSCVGGLSDIEAPLNELSALNIHPQIVLVVENLESGIALPDMQGVVAVMGLGKAVGVLARLPWVYGRPAYYWGDIDTQGLSILSLARAIFPALVSIMMDVATLLQFKELAVDEPAQVSSVLENLTSDEQALYEGLRNGTWGPRLRLEQERLPWHYVLKSLTDISKVLTP
ncbi:hypothetical protein GTP91_17200 [Rugamonas sp. FT82W]|uniref:DUF3322 and DUF2220 domain-containing protein n=1 Tax=Duganella vulcania TaxID=2692166 RepID=A0A845G3K3_9BURK|nr:DUF3322 and DUF2220 domain-containing protein [Duganella vulcania]MYM88904.1 hypothetical protein [Duganella vulcania]